MRRPGFDNLLTVVRGSDGARESYAFRSGDDVEKACDFELAGWFDRHLDAVANGG